MIVVVPYCNDFNIADDGAFWICAANGAPCVKNRHRAFTTPISQDEWLAISRCFYVDAARRSRDTCTITSGYLTRWTPRFLTCSVVLSLMQLPSNGAQMPL